MEESRKNTYELPVMKVIEIKPKGIVCASGEVPDFYYGWDLEF